MREPQRPLPRRIRSGKEPEARAPRPLLGSSALGPRTQRTSAGVGGGLVVDEDAGLGEQLFEPQEVSRVDGLACATTTARSARLRSAWKRPRQNGVQNTASERSRRLSVGVPHRRHGRSAWGSPFGRHRDGLMANEIGPRRRCRGLEADEGGQESLPAAWSRPLDGDRQGGRVTLRNPQRAESEDLFPHPYRRGCSRRQRY